MVNYVNSNSLTGPPIGSTTNLTYYGYYGSDSSGQNKYCGRAYSAYFVNPSFATGTNTNYALYAADLTVGNTDPLSALPSGGMYVQGNSYLNNKVGINTQPTDATQLGVIASTTSRFGITLTGELRSTTSGTIGLTISPNHRIASASDTQYSMVNMDIGPTYICTGPTGLASTNTIYCRETWMGGGPIQNHTSIAVDQAGISPGSTITMVNNYGVRVAQLAPIGTHRYGLHVTKPNPALATIAIAAYLEDCSIGSAITPPSSGLFVSGDAQFNSRVGIGVPADSIIPLTVNGTAQFIGANGNITCTGIRFSTVSPQTYLSTYMEEKLTLTWQVTVATGSSPAWTGNTDVIFTRFGRTVTASITGPSLNPITGALSAGYPQSATGQIPSRYAVSAVEQFIPLWVDLGAGTRFMGVIRMTGSPNPTWYLYAGGATSLPFTVIGNYSILPFTQSITYNVA
jgi:hypothetical protein